MLMIDRTGILPITTGAGFTGRYPPGWIPRRCSRSRSKWRWPQRN